MSEIESLISSIKGVRFAEIDYEVSVPTAAKHRDVKITKKVTANVQLFGNLKEYTDVYSNAVKKTGNRIVENDKSKLENFDKSDTWFEHTNFFSIVEHKTTRKKYLFAIFNNAKTVYFIDEKEVPKEEVVPFLTPSDAKKVLEPNEVVYNKKNDILHLVQCRTIALENITNFR